MKQTTYYLELNKERIKTELDNIEDELVMYSIYKFIMKVRKGLKYGL